MISLEQVQLLESKVTKAIEYVRRVTAENAALASERTGLQAKLDANQKRIDELEVLIMRFKEDQSRIEDGIIAALDRLSQFEEAFEHSLKDKASSKKPAAKPREKSPELPQGGEGSKVTETPPDGSASSSSEIFFEITETDEQADGSGEQGSSAEGELDIF